MRRRESWAALRAAGGGKAVLLHELNALGFLEVFADHFLHQVRKANLRFPAESLAGLARVAHQAVHLGRAEMVRVDGHNAPPLLVISELFRAFSLPSDLHAEFFTCGDDEF